MSFVVCKSLAAPLIMGFEYCDWFVQAIRPCIKQVELEDEIVIPIVRQPLKRAIKWQVPLLAAQEALLATRKSTKLLLVSNIVIPLKSKVTVLVSSRNYGLAIFRALPALYEIYQSAIANRDVPVTPDHPLQVFAAKLAKKPQRLTKHHVIETVTPNKLITMLPTCLTASMVLRITTHDVENSTHYVPMNELHTPNRPLNVTVVAQAGNDEQLKSGNTTLDPI